VKWVLGFGCSGALLSAAALYEKARVIVIASGVASVDVSRAGDYIFRTWPSDSSLIEVLYRRLRSAHRRVGFLSQQTEYAQSVIQALKARRAADHASELELLNEDFVGEQNDFRSELLRLKNRRIDALFINSQDEFVFLNVFRQAKSVVSSLQIYGTSIPGGSAFREKAGRSASGIIFADVPGASEILGNDAGREMFRRFVLKYGAPVSWDAGVLTSYEAFRAMHLAITSGAEPREFLYRARFNGVFGEWGFDRNGDVLELSSILKRIDCTATGENQEGSCPIIPFMK